MLLTQLIGKPVYSGKHPRGTVAGLYLSLKTKAVRYLLCQTTQKNARTEFAVSVTAIASIGEAVTLKRLKTLFPKNVARMVLNRPIYTIEGEHLGSLADAELENFTLTGIITESEKRYSATCISALSDAVILKKSPPYPLGQRVPAPHLLPFPPQKSNSPTVTRALLKEAIEQKKLVALTLYLSPFNT